MRNNMTMQGLFVPFACVGSGDPVRVLRLYTTNTLDTLWSIYCWDSCTTCRYRIYVLLAQALWFWDFLLLIRTLQKYLTKCAPTLTYICACVDASRTVFWDRSTSRTHVYTYTHTHTHALSLSHTRTHTLIRVHKIWKHTHPLTPGFEAPKLNILGPI